jgi:diphthine synthase
MTVNQCVAQLLEVEHKRKENVYSEKSIGIGVARIGQDDQIIISGTLEELLKVDFGKPLHSFVLPGEMHFLEQNAIQLFTINSETPRLPVIEPKSEEDSSDEE